MKDEQIDALNSLNPTHATIINDMIDRKIEVKVENSIDDKFKSVEKHLQNQDAKLDKLMQLISGDTIQQTKGLLKEHREMYDDYLVCKVEHNHEKLQIAYSTYKDLNNIDGVNTIKDIQFVIKSWKFFGSILGVTSVAGAVSFLNSIFHWY